MRLIPQAPALLSSMLVVEALIGKERERETSNDRCEWVNLHDT